MARIIAQNVSTSFVTEEHNYTLARLSADPLGAPYVDPYKAFLDNLKKVRDEELRLLIQQSSAQALVDFCDDNLDGFVDVLANSILLITGNDRSHALWIHYFGTKSPSLLKKPILGKQLETMRAWIPSLKSASQPSLHDLGTKLEVLVTAADEALKAKAKAEQQNKDFRNLGMRRDFIVAFNKLRKDAHNGLDKIVQDHPEKNLAKNFADQFFRQAETDSIPGLEEELSQLKIEIEETQQTLTERQARYATLSAQKTALEQEEAQHQRDLADLAAAEEAAAALRAKISKKK
jgi:hypothetical protein